MVPGSNGKGLADPLSGLTLSRVDRFRTSKLQRQTGGLSHQGRQCAASMPGSDVDFTVPPEQSRLVPFEDNRVSHNSICIQGFQVTSKNK
jgi:hypothetical protein